MEEVLLNTKDIKIRIGQLSPHDVQLLTYIDATTLYNMLDKTFGRRMWTTLPPPGIVLAPNEKVIGVWDSDRNTYVYQVGTGEQSSISAEKGLESDALKRAGVKFGIARELGTTPKMIFPAEKLKRFYDDQGRITDDDIFAVQDVEFAEESETRRISNITITVSDGKEIYLSGTFFQDRDPVYTDLIANEKNDRSQHSVVSAASLRQQSSEQAKNQSNAVCRQNAQRNSQQSQHEVVTGPNAVGDADAVLDDDEIILLGNLKGRKYKDVKGSPEWGKFLKWLAQANITNARYDLGQREQFVRIKNTYRMYNS